MSKINVKDFFIGAVIGGIVGAASAALLAPKSGKELRTDICQKATAAKDKSIVLTNAALEKGAEYGKYAREKSTELTDAVKSQWDKVAEGAEAVVDKAVQAGSDIAEALKSEKDNGRQLAEQVVNEIEETGDRLQEDNQASTK
ncbi:Gas vesicle protein [Evansella caseinilytica]|uniref:Gas vesicle protein n=1 Tax=Evansella caseinilytica TaxID=1503961 RepID=A0A1H3KSS5_9BACI|nr:YtxH domain-containing protein [Evansella caseinilytica]SDY55039.1 Gas vesicle protein [Evansella caseinilytica]